jgi:6-phosphogluconolactonase
MPVTTEIEVYPDPAALAQAGAEQFVSLAAEAIAARKRFSVALSGGSTPKAMFGLLATDEFARRIDWLNVYVFWGDERCVPPDHADSNYKMAVDTLLSHVPLLPDHIYRMKGEIEPTEAAAAYEQLLKTFFADDPHFDLILLGMGDDGHTASLFPGTAAVHETQRWVLAHYVQKVSMWRLTLTPPMINAARTVTFQVAGAGKAERLRQVLKGPYQPGQLPSQIVNPVDGELVWMLDKAAAALL